MKIRKILYKLFFLANLRLLPGEILARKHFSTKIAEKFHDTINIALDENIKKNEIDIFMKSLNIFTAIFPRDYAIIDKYVNLIVELSLSGRGASVDRTLIFCHSVKE